MDTGDYGGNTCAICGITVFQLTLGERRVNAKLSEGCK
jgi:hypothetical protein